MKRILGQIWANQKFAWPIIQNAEYQVTFPQYGKHCYTSRLLLCHIVSYKSPVYGIGTEDSTEKGRRFVRACCSAKFQLVNSIVL